MTRSNELHIPDHWLKSAAAVNAAKILGPRRKEYQEIREVAMYCHCTSRPQRLVRFFLGPLDEDRSTRIWVLVNERARGGTGRATIPAMAEVVKVHGGRAITLVAECRHCKKGMMVIPCGEAAAATLLAQMLPGVSIITDEGEAVRGETEVRVHTGWRPGPLGTVIADFDPPAHQRIDL